METIDNLDIIHLTQTWRVDISIFQEQGDRAQIGSDCHRLIWIGAKSHG